MKTQKIIPLIPVVSRRS